jgi:hypothetical protein
MTNKTEANIITDSNLFAKELTFSKYPFNYKILYFDQEISIECIHQEEYFSWREIIRENITSKDVDLNSSLHIPTRPSKLFRLFCEYKENRLDSIYTFKFQDNFKDPGIPITIELETKLPYDDDIDYKVIYLQPVRIDESKRFDFKIDHARSILENKHRDSEVMLLSKITELELQIQRLSNKFEKNMDLERKYLTIEIELERYMSEIKNKMSELEKEFFSQESQVDKFAEVTALDGKFVAK